MIRDLPYPDPLPLVDPRWLTSDVLGVARGIHEERAFERLPVLVDALMDAGCDADWVLDHFLGPLQTCPRCDGKKGWFRDDPVFAWCACSLCKETGHIRSAHNYPVGYDQGRGCWECECWLVNHLLKETQPVRAKIPWDNGEESEDGRTATVVNPGACAGWTWLVAVHDMYDPPLYIVEAVSASDAEEEFVDSEYGKHQRVSADDPDYAELASITKTNQLPIEYQHLRWRDHVRFTSNGHPYDGENIHVYGLEQGNSAHDIPYHCLYYGPGLPGRGVDPRDYADFGPAGKPCQHCAQPFWPVPSPRSPPIARRRVLRRNAQVYCSECTAWLERERRPYADGE